MPRILRCTKRASKIATCHVRSWTGTNANAYRGALEEVIDSSCLGGNVSVIVSGQIAHGTVQPFQLLNIFRQPVRPREIQILLLKLPLLLKTAKIQCLAKSKLDIVAQVVCHICNDKSSTADTEHDGCLPHEPI